MNTINAATSSFLQLFTPRKKTFTGVRFKRLFLSAIICCTVDYIGTLVNAMIAGNMLGEKALAAISLVNPFITISVFIVYMTAIGSGHLMCEAAGEGDGDKVKKIFTQGLILTVIAGVLTSIVYLLIWPNLYSFIDIEPQMVQYTKQYFTFITVYPLIQGVSAYLFCTVVGQGGERLCALAGVGQLIVNVGLALLLSQKFGMMGLSFSIVASVFVSGGVVATYFLRQKRTIGFLLSFSWKTVLKMLRISFAEASSILSSALMHMVVNVILIFCFGGRGLAVLAVLYSLCELRYELFDTLGEGIGPLIATYYAENNCHGLRNTMRIAAKVALICGIGVSVLFFVLSPFIPEFFGVKDATLLESTILGVRAVSAVSFIAAFVTLLSAYYMRVQKSIITVTNWTLSMFVAPVAMVSLFSLTGNLDAVWVGFAISLPIGFGISLLLACLFKKGRKMPLLLDNEKYEKELYINVPQTEEGIMDAVYRVSDALKQKGVDSAAVFKGMNLIEESQMLAKKHNLNKNTIVEVSVTVEESEISIILRDTGTYVDITDSDARVTSLESFAAMRLIGNIQRSEYFTPNGNNRTIFTIPRRE